MAGPLHTQRMSPIQPDDPSAPWTEARIIGEASERDRSYYETPLTKRSSVGRHENIWPWLSTFANREGFRVLEIGSRAVISDSVWKQFIPRCAYTGFDIIEGKNVDVTGDAHQLSRLFDLNSFDLVITSAVFEHLAMPWVVAEEIAKVLDIGGILCLETTLCFGEHELPWHFFQFNANALECLFNRSLGFEVIDSGVDNPMIGRFAHDACDYLRGKPIGGLWCHSSIVVRKVENVFKDPEAHHDWRASLKTVTGQTMYPRNSGLSA